MGLNVEFSCDDGLGPHTEKPERFDVILVLNWLMLVPAVCLPSFLSTYASLLNPGGVLFLDVIDRSYGDVDKNEYLTSEWTKPEKERRPTEYKSRFTYQDVASASAESGLAVEDVWKREQIIPRHVYRLRRTESANMP